MTVLEDIAALRAALAEVEAEMRGAWDASLEDRRNALLHRLDQARGQKAAAEPPETRHPVLLLPVRLEARFAWQDPGDPARHMVVRPPVPVATPVLLVRIYPDDVHIDQHDPALTRQELGWQREYLKAAERGHDRAVFVAAWEKVVTRAGPTRAAWIVHSRPPFQPVVVDRKLGRAARAALLPDRFEALVDVRGGPRLTATGALVREPLDVTPDPLRSVSGLRWMTDFGEALAAGLALIVPLPASAAVPPVLDRLLVVGVHASRDAAASALEFSRLLDAHHYTSGLAFIRPGAATNATPGERTDRTTTPTADQVYAVEGDASPLTSRTTLVDIEPADGRDAAQLLGLDPLVFGHVAGADGRVRQGGRDLRRLIASAWRGPLQRLLEPLVTPAELADAVDLYVDEVDALGPLPALRVGEQPYGVLPVSVLTSQQSDLSDAERRILRALETLRSTVWEPAAGTVARIGGPPADPTRTLLTILRQDGVLAELAVRPALGPETAAAVTSTFDQPRRDALSAARQRIETLVTSLRQPPTAPPVGGLLLTEDLPVTLPLIGTTYGDDLDRLSLYNAPAEALLELAYGAPAAQPSVLASIARLALLESADRSCRDLLVTQGVVDAATVAAWERDVNDDTIPMYDLVDRLAASIPTDPRPSLWQALMSTAPPAGSEPFLDARSAVRALASPPGVGPGRPRRHPPELLETLLRAELGGLATRLDSWFTALATRRLRRLRSLPGAGTGLLLGAYGVLLDVVPNTPALAAAPEEVPAGHTGEVIRTASDAGYVHAPGVAHAVTAAVLRSAHLGQWRLAPAGPGRDAFSVDLSSKRVRTAMHLISGVREGQPLAALLGYRIERWLRQAAPAGIAVVRRAAPLVAGRLTGDVPVEQVAADSVVDALTLLDRVGEPTPAAVEAVLTPHRGAVTVTDWPGVVSATVAAIADARDAADAVADLLVAEGVFQLVQGNPARSAGAVDAISAAGSPPPVPAVVDSVRGGTAAVHRVVVALPATATPTDDPGGWALTPRADLEPTLETWARTILPPPPAVLLPLRLSALDVVASTPEQLRARIDAAAPEQAAGVADSATDDLIEAASAVRDLLTAARPLEPADLAPSGGRPDAIQQPTGALGRLEGFAAAVLAARSALDAAITASEAGVLQAALLAADLVGTSQPVPAGADLLDLIPAAQTARAELTARLAADDPTAGIRDRMQALAEGRAWVLPALTPATAFPGPPPAGATPEELQWHVMRSAVVRPGVARLDRALGVMEALSGTVPSLSVTQWPLDPAERWVALGGGPIQGGRTAVLAHTPFPTAATIAGLFVDEWTDVVPDPEVTTSLAFAYDAPSGTAPNVALLGVRRPGAERWSRDELAGVVQEALALARIRAVDSDTLAGLAGQLLPPLVSRENPTPGVSPTLDVPTLTQPL